MKKKNTNQESRIKTQINIKLIINTSTNKLYLPILTGMTLELVLGRRKNNIAK